MSRARSSSPRCPRTQPGQSAIANPVLAHGFPIFGSIVHQRHRRVRSPPTFTLLPVQVHSRSFGHRTLFERPRIRSDHTLVVSRASSPAHSIFALLLMLSQVTTA